MSSSILTTRRELGRLGLGALGLTLAAPFARARRVQVVDDLAARILATPRESLLRLVEAELRKGATWRTLQTACFQAGVRDIGPIAVGGELHAVLVVPSVCELASRESESEALLPVIFNLAELKKAQADDVEEGDWKLPPRPAVEPGEPAAQYRALEQALRARDAGAGDRAVTALLAKEDPRRVYECFWPAGARCFAGLAHKMILAAQAHRALEFLGWEHAEPTLRMLASAYSDRYRIGEYPDDDQARAAAGELRDPLNGLGDPEVSLALFRRLSGASPAEGMELAVASLNDGMSSATFWDAIFLAASDVFARGPGLLPVHAVTVADALAYGYHASSISAPTTRKLLLVQAAAWMPTFRDDFAARRNLSMDGPGLDDLELGDVEDDVSVEDVFREPTRQKVVGCVSGGRRSEFEMRLRRTLHCGATEVHQLKFAAAVLANASRAHPRLAPWILAPVLDYLPTASTPETELHARSVELITRLG